MEEKEVTNNELAVLINKGFQGMQGQFNGMQGQLNELKDKVDYIDARLGRMENDFKEIKGDMVKRLEFEDALARIKLLEKKVGVESGK